MDTCVGLFNTCEKDRRTCWFFLTYYFKVLSFCLKISECFINQNFDLSLDDSEEYY